MKDQRVLLLNDGSELCSDLHLIFDFINQIVELVDVNQLTKFAAQRTDLLAIIVNPATIMTRLNEISVLIKQLFPNVPLLYIGDQKNDFSNEHVFEVINSPFDHTQLLNILHHCQQYIAQGSDSNDQPVLRELADVFVGESTAICNLRKVVSKVAVNDVNILILGESGTGKEVVARCLHQQSHRSHKPFVPVNCGAIPGELLESELFGHEKGAFTGAFSARKGRFEMAEGGTIFLDEIGDMPMVMQVKLLRVLQERCFERVGSSKLITADVHVIAATHRNLECAITEGKFREDLYYRLNVFPIYMPALRDRIADLPLLIHSLAAQLGKRQHCHLHFTDRVIDTLSQYSWPGNVRELANLIERLMVVNPNGIIDVSDLPVKYQLQSDQLNDFALGIEEKQTLLQSKESIDIPILPKEGINLKEHLMQTELAFIKQALELSSGVVARAAENLGMRRTTLVEKMRKYNIKRQESVVVEEMMC